MQVELFDAFGFSLSWRVSDRDPILSVEPSQVTTIEAQTRVLTVASAAQEELHPNNDTNIDNNAQAARPR